MRSQPVVALLISLLVLTFASQDAFAKRNKGRSSTFNADREFGLGIMIGQPTGLSGKYYLGGSTAIDFGIANYYRYRYEYAFHLHADFLWHPLVLVDADAFQLPLHFGVGARILDHGDREYFEDNTHLGVRVPVGLTFYFKNVPLDIFVEIAYVLDIVSDDRHSYSDFNSNLGIRYYF